MSERVVGLDIGSHAVRAAEVRTGDVPELRGFGQVGLPRGAVEHGEVIDPGAVAASLRRLWREARIRDRRVRVGVANLRTIVRQVEMPAMPAEDLRSALEFQAGEFIPLPIDETELDFQVLETFTNEGGEPMVRVLIAAAHKDMVGNVLAAVREAGLQAVGIDLVPFALVRALGDGSGVPLTPAPPTPPTPPPESETPEGDDDEDATLPVPTPVGATQAIVSVGSGVTVVVIHEGGVPRFVRIVAAGGDDLTEAASSALEIPFDDAEALKRGLAAGGAQVDEARLAIEPPLTNLVNEIRGSIDFYASQAEAQPVDDVLITGGGVLLDGFLDRLTDNLASPVRVADPYARLQVGDIGFAEAELDLLRPYLAVPVGLALGGAKGAPYLINLLPGKEQRVIARSRLVVAGAAGLAGLLALLALVTAGRSAELSDAKDELEAQQAVNQQLQNRIAALDGARELQQQVEESRTLVAKVLGTDVSWSRILQEISRVIPSDVWLETISGNAAGGEGETAGVGDTINGAITFTAFGGELPSTAAWLQRIATVPSFSSPWVSQAQASTTSVAGLEVPVINFSATAALTEGGRSERSRVHRAEAGIQSDGGSATTTPTTAPPPAEG